MSDYKYQKLLNYFMEKDDDTIELSFSDIENIIGSKLVESAYNHSAFWISKSSPTHVFPLAWETAGYEIDKRGESLNEQIKQRKIKFIKKVTYQSEIIRALIGLEGQASLKEILSYINKRNVLPYIHTNPNWDRRVSAELQEHCSATKSYTGVKDIFYSVEGLGKGFWGLISYREEYDFIDDFGIRPYEKRIIKKVKENNDIGPVEKEIIIKARIGQGKFRDSLIEKYNSCIVTGIKDKRLLIASHIKPWAKCDTDQERINLENGLLLTPLYDKLFDSGLITFILDGKMFVSETISDEDKTKLMLINRDKFDLKGSNEMKTFLQYHNDVLFVK